MSIGHALKRAIKLCQDAKDHVLAQDYEAFANDRIELFGEHEFTNHQDSSSKEIVADGSLVVIVRNILLELLHRYHGMMVHSIGVTELHENDIASISKIVETLTQINSSEEAGYLYQCANDPSKIEATRVVSILESFESTFLDLQTSLVQAEDKINSIINQLVTHQHLVNAELTYLHNILQEAKDVD